jgi:chitinase
MLNLVDFVWPQFYGAPSCNIGSNGFNDSFAGWAGRLDGPKLYLGAPAFAAAVTNGGYQDPQLFSETILAARSLGRTKFGGVMLWDGPYAQLNKDSEGKDYVNVTKSALLQR